MNSYFISGKFRFSEQGFHMGFFQNVILPLDRMAEFEQEKIIGHLAPTAYSYYGFQWQNTGFLTEATEPISNSIGGD